MALLRWIALPVIVGSIMVGFSFYSSDDGSLIDKLAAKRADAAAQQQAVPASAVASDTPVPAVPTDTQTPVAPSTQTPTSTPTSTATDSPAPQTATDTPIAGATATANAETGTPTPTPLAVTPTATASTTPSATPTAVSTEVIVDSNGGTVVSPDGRATLNFPPGATSERLAIRVSDLVNAAVPSIPRGHLLSMWQFDASAIDRGGVAVHQFSSSINIDLRYSPLDLVLLDAGSIHYWTLDEASQTWVESTATPVDAYHWNVSLNHFSTQATSSDGKIGLPPILEGAQVNLMTGSAQFSMPIDVAPGIGAVTPNLALSYSSARVDETDNGPGGATRHQTPAGWTGIGWDLSTPSITLGAGGRVYLNMNGVGGELIWAGNAWHTRSEQFAQITGCAGTPGGGLSSLSCSFMVRDTAGNTYVFGANDQSKRYYAPIAGLGGPGSTTYYQLDLSSVTDSHGNTATYEYQQVRGTCCGTFQAQGWQPWIISSYPSRITYPGGRVEFILKSGQLSPAFLDASGSQLSVRSDVAACESGESSFIQVQETQALDHVSVESWNNGAYVTARTYQLNSTSGSTCDSSGTKLNFVDIMGDGSPAGTLTHVSFDYNASAMNTIAASKSAGGTCTVDHSLTNIRLTAIHNGFGGTTSFLYQPTPIVPGYPACSILPSGQHIFSRFLVDTKTTNAGSAWPASIAPDITTRYDYAGGPNWIQDGPIGGNQFKVIFAGYGTVTEKDAEQNQIVHTFIIGGGAQSQSSNSELGGRETQVKVLGHEPTPVVWQQIDSVYEATAVATPVATEWVPYFDTLKSRTLTVKGGHQSRTSYTYNNTTNGAPLTVTEDGDASTPYNADCRVKTLTYTTPSAGNLSLPASQAMSSCAAPSVVEAETDNFYDGSGTLGAAPSVGNLTAARQLVSTSLPAGDPQKYVYTFHSYYGNGSLFETSVPIYGSSTVSPTGGVNGVLPGNQGRMVLEYDPLSVPTPVGTATPVGRFPTKQTVYVYNSANNPAAVPTQVTQITYDRTLGVPIDVIAPNNMETITGYDQYGRQTTVWTSLDGANAPGTQYLYTLSTSGANNVRVRSRLTTTTTAQIDALKCFDGLGREAQDDVPVGDNFQRSTKIFNARGLATNSHVFASSLTCAPSQAGVGTTPNNYVEYDPLGNALTVTNSAAGTPVACSPSCVSVNIQTQSNGFIPIDGLTTTTIDQNGHRTDTVHDGLGRVKQKITYTGNNSGTYALYSITAFTYDDMDHVLTVTDNYLNQDVITYDALGRKVSMTDPDMSATDGSGARIPWRYEYDAAGNLTKQTDARGAVTNLTYDSLNRIKHKDYTATGGIAASPAVDYSYDSYDSDTICGGIDGLTAVGKQTVMVDESGTTRSCYDIRGRVVRKRMTINAPSYDPNHVDVGCATWSRTYDLMTAYDAGNRITDITYPTEYRTGSAATETVHYGYDYTLVGAGKLRTLSGTTNGGPPTTYVSGATYDLTGNPATIVMGNGYTTSYDRLTDPRNRLTHITTTNGATGVQDLRYVQDEKGNVSQIVDSIASESSAYTYDELDRLTGMYINASQTPTASYTYDDSATYGGKTGNMTSKTEGGGTKAFTYGVNHVHAPSSVAGDALSYDKNGNLNAASGSLASSYTFDAENRLSYSIASAAWTEWDYLYNGAGDLVRRKQFYLFAQGAYDVKDTFVGGLYEEESHGCDGANVPATTVTKYYSAFGRAIASSANGAVSYLLADHLGSTTATMTGGTAQQVQYYPFGATRSGAPPEKGYTGQQQEPASPIGLYYYHARFYSTTTAHFVSADTLAIDGLNRYAYAGNNPVKYTDPSGRCVQDGQGGWLPCGRDTMIQFFSCAWGGACNAGANTDAVRSYARGVISGDAFKYFVGLESAANGDIILRLTLGVTVKGAGRNLPHYPHHDIVGDYLLTVDVNATRRKFITGSAGFAPGAGLPGGVLDGWKERRNAVNVREGGANLVLDAGPGQSLVDDIKNFFGLTDYHEKVTWDLWFEADGSLGQEIIANEEGGPGILKIVVLGLAGSLLPSDLPGDDELLANAGLSLTVSEVQDSN